ncbi:homogentisate 1,2-dioxygenase [Photobacterium aphoticum]|uniref:Dioxygenase n=1 Tax=Photobacterium aphoticum TaxID=754436 RepID=A0A0J1GJF6_9GAMM|nr:homogentisate 1,2-dioxygenase [Photobacterium aphoticum]KLU99814.1 dioxygenase [Photobacterium aphoticum]PSU59499.1 homogentisate 1,2-dioxygenase [Photobacterium aphoticum]GHA40238.1 homogentisate 1,2-dioxygenase [Photobacterium aphoticum]
MPQWFQFPITEGQASRQAHCDLPEGTYERECGKEGFFGPASHMYHRHPPTGWIAWEGPLRPRAIDTNKLDAAVDSPWQAPLVLFNDQLKLRVWHCSQAMTQLARNGDGDEALFVHHGSGDLFCDYGHLPLEEGDYVILPRATSWRIEPHSPMRLLMIEATHSSYQMADRGLIGQHAIYDPAMLEHAKINDRFLDQQQQTHAPNGQPWQVQLKARNQLNILTYPYNPLDAQGWKGNLTAFKLNWRAIRPIMSHRYHVPPSAHTTFVAEGFVICTFVPRPIETDPGALKVPFFHNNDDYDEVLFYHRGNFFSRDNIEAGMITHHPCGFSHGPHPKALAASLAANNAALDKAEGDKTEGDETQTAKKETDEVAVMIDARYPLEVAELPDGVENTDYVYSWLERPD